MNIINTQKIGLTILCTVIAAWIACGAACAGVKVTLEKKGSYFCWIAYKDAKGVEQISNPARFKGKETDLDVAALGAKFTNAKLHVFDKRSGNVSIVDYIASADPKKPAAIDIKESDFQYAPTVNINVVSEEGAPLESALVKLTDGEGSVMLKTLTPADNGVAMFSGVATGDVEVTVEAEGAKKTIDGEFKLPEKRDSAGFEKVVKVSGDVDTLPVVAKTGSKPAAAKETKQSGGAGLLQTIAGFIFLAVIIAVVFVVLKSKGVTAKSALQQMGVSIPADESNAVGSASAPAVDPNVCQFCGKTKDASGNCACAITGAPSPFGSASVGPSGPRLIGSQGTYSGNIFMINNMAVIGREATNSVPLPNDTTASRRHATITASNGEYMIKDEGSSNGTFVNGAKIIEQKLMPGDEVQIGATKFRFEV